MVITSSIKGPGIKIPQDIFKNNDDAANLLSEGIDGDIFCDGDVCVMPSHDSLRVLNLATGELYEFRQASGESQGVVERRKMGVVGQRIVDAALDVYHRQVNGEKKAV